MTSGPCRPIRLEQTDNDTCCCRCERACACLLVLAPFLDLARQFRSSPQHENRKRVDKGGSTLNWPGDSQRSIEL